MLESGGRIGLFLAGQKPANPPVRAWQLPECERLLREAKSWSWRTLPARGGRNQEGQG